MQCINIFNYLREDAAKLTDDLVAREMLPGGKFGSAEELRDLVGEDGLFKGLDRYKPVPWLGSRTGPNALPLPFTGYPIYLFMTTIALVGQFDIQKNIYHLPALRGSSEARRIPMSTWTIGMLLVSLTLCLRILYSKAHWSQLAREQLFEDNRLADKSIR
jgi:hypothetical protein